jgi:20S proteasome alpha/beta subunit
MERQNDSLLTKNQLNWDSMAINFKDGVILGADSRTTTGAYIANRVTDKLTQVHDTIWCCRSGSAADTQAVADIVSYHLGMYGIVNDEPPTTQTAAALFQELCYENKDSLRYVFFFLLIKRVPYELEANPKLVAG